MTAASLRRLDEIESQLDAPDLTDDRHHELAAEWVRTMKAEASVLSPAHRSALLADIDKTAASLRSNPPSTKAARSAASSTERRTAMTGASPFEPAGHAVIDQRGHVLDDLGPGAPNAKQAAAIATKDYLRAFGTYLRKGTSGLQGTEVKVLQEGVDEQGGFLVPADIAARIIARPAPAAALQRAASDENAVGVVDAGHVGVHRVALLATGRFVRVGLAVLHADHRARHLSDEDVLIGMGDGGGLCTPATPRRFASGEHEEAGDCPRRNPLPAGRPTVSLLCHAASSFLGAEAIDCETLTTTASRIDQDATEGPALRSLGPSAPFLLVAASGRRQADRAVSSPMRTSSRRMSSACSSASRATARCSTPTLCSKPVGPGWPTSGQGTAHDRRRTAEITTL